MTAEVNIRRKTTIQLLAVNTQRASTSPQETDVLVNFDTLTFWILEGLQERRTRQHLPIWSRHNNMSDQIDEHVVEVFKHEVLEPSCFEHAQGRIEEREGSGDGDVF